MLKEDK